MTWLRTYAATHLFWIIVAACALGYLHEHDNGIRLKAEASQQEKASEQVNAELRARIAERDKVADRDVAKVRTVVQQAKTPEQVVQAIPQLTDVPLNTRAIPGNLTDVQVDAPALIQFAGQCKADAVNLARCEADLRDQEGIAAQLTQEKAAWKKAAGHRSFLGKVWNESKNVLAIAGAVAGLVIVARH